MSDKTQNGAQNAPCFFRRTEKFSQNAERRRTGGPGPVSPRSQLAPVLDMMQSGYQYYVYTCKQVDIRAVAPLFSLDKRNPQPLKRYYSPAKRLFSAFTRLPYAGIG